MDDLLLSRVEDASLNASAPPQQRWLDGWLMRFNPGKARRARCINALVAGRMPLDQRLDLATAAYAEASLPLVVRLHRYSQPAGLDAELAARGFDAIDDTPVMVCTDLSAHRALPLPADAEWLSLAADDYARVVGGLRGSSPGQVHAHAERLRRSPVRYQGHALSRRSDGAVLACGQFAREGDLVGLYDIHTPADQRGQGWASLLCERLLSSAASQGARVGYLQVEADNLGAQRIYARLGFAEAYRYHYRQAP